MTVPDPAARPTNRATTSDQRRAIRESAESVRTLARRLGLNPKTVAKWKARKDNRDRPRGRRPGETRKLTAEEESIVVQFREHTLLPLDDCLYALQAQIPNLSRSTLYRCLQRHGLGRLPGLTGPARAPEPASGTLQVDCAEVRSLEGTHFSFSAIERASRFAFVSIGRKGDSEAASAFLAAIADGSPLPIREAWTPDGEPFTASLDRHGFKQGCRALGIQHRIRTGHDQTRSAEGLAGTSVLAGNIAYASEAHLVSVLRDFVHAYNFQRRLKALGGKTPYEALCLALSRQSQGPARDAYHDFVKLELMQH